MRKKIVPKPSNKSWYFVSVMCSIIDIQDSRNSLDFPLIPRRPFICDEAIVIAAAVVKPTVTGTDIKLTKKPEIQI